MLNYWKRYTKVCNGQVSVNNNSWLIMETNWIWQKKLKEWLILVTLSNSCKLTTGMRSCLITVKLGGNSIEKYSPSCCSSLRNCCWVVGWRAHLPRCLDAWETNKTVAGDTVKRVPDHTAEFLLRHRAWSSSVAQVSIKDTWWSIMVDDDWSCAGLWWLMMLNHRWWWSRTCMCQTTVWEAPRTLMMVYDGWYLDPMMVNANEEVIHDIQMVSQTCKGQNDVPNLGSQPRLWR